MKKFFIIAIVIVSLAFTFSACTGYEEGPSFSLLTPEMRIKGTWSQTELYVNDELQSNDYQIEFTFASDGTGTRTTSLGSGSVTDDIEWKFNDDKTILMFKKTDETEWSETAVLRLTNSEMWLNEDLGVFGLWQFRYEKL